MDCFMSLKLQDILNDIDLMIRSVIQNGSTQYTMIMELNRRRRRIYTKINQMNHIQDHMMVCRSLFAGSQLQRCVH